MTPPRPRRRGLFLDGALEGYSMRQGADKRFQSKTTDRHQQTKPGRDQNACYPDAIGGLFGCPRQSSLQPAARLAQKKYDTGATDTEIKIGNTMPYSGRLRLRRDRQDRGRLFQEDQCRGRHQRPQDQLHHYDDGYSPPKTVEQARKLVESDEVLLIFNSLGTPPNSAIQKYMNTKKVPQMFVAPAPPSGTIRRTSPGPWAGSPATRARRRSTPNTS